MTALLIPGCLVEHLQQKTEIQRKALRFAVCMVRQRHTVIRREVLGCSDIQLDYHVAVLLILWKWKSRVSGSHLDLLSVAQTMSSSDYCVWLGEGSGACGIAFSALDDEADHKRILVINLEDKNDVQYQ